MDSDCDCEAAGDDKHQQETATVTTNSTAIDATDTCEVFLLAPRSGMVLVVHGPPTLPYGMY